jgi:hypothetical protein
VPRSWVQSCTVSESMAIVTYRYVFRWGGCRLGAPFWPSAPAVSPQAGAGSGEPRRPPDHSALGPDVNATQWPRIAFERFPPRTSSRAVAADCGTCAPPRLRARTAGRESDVSKHAFPPPAGAVRRHADCSKSAKRTNPADNVMRDGASAGQIVGRNPDTFRQTVD